jgi:hypothetical protein
MFTPPDTAIRELDQRTSDAMTVTLFWDSGTGRVFVAVEDQRGDDWFTVDVRPRNALDAFHHPYAYRRPDYAGQRLAA